jgi:hypothetical protein
MHHNGLLGRSVSSKTGSTTVFWSAMLCVVPIVAQSSTAQAATPVTPNIPTITLGVVKPAVPAVVVPIADRAVVEPSVVAVAPVAVVPAAVVPVAVVPAAQPIADPAPQVVSTRLSETAAAVSIRSFLRDRAVSTGTEARQLLEAEQAAARPDPNAPLAIAQTYVDEVGSLADSGAESLRRKLLIKPLAVGRDRAYAPGTTAGGPSAFGADFGDAYTGLALGDGHAKNNNADAAFATGFGLGDARRAVGLEVNISSGSIAKFGSNGDVGLKLHRNLPGNAAVAIGWDSGITWGKANRDTVSTVYGVATKAFPLNPGSAVNKMPLTVSLGIGGGRFRSYEAADKGSTSLGVFGSLGLQVAPQAALVSTWTGRDLNVGVSFVPVKKLPIFVTAGAANVFGNNDTNRLFTFSIGMGFNYSNAFR